jgi:hypothetical protein
VTAQAVLGTAALALAAIALGLGLANRGKGRRPAAVLLPVAIILGTLHWVVQLSPLIDLFLTITSLLLAVAALWDLFRRRDDQAGIR